MLLPLLSPSTFISPLQSSAKSTFNLQKISKVITLSPFNSAPRICQARTGRIQHAKVQCRKASLRHLHGVTAPVHRQHTALVSLSQDVAGDTWQATMVEWLLNVSISTLLLQYHFTKHHLLTQFEFLELSDYALLYDIYSQNMTT